MLLISIKSFIDLIQLFHITCKLAYAFDTVIHILFHITFKLAYTFDINKLFYLLNTIISYNFKVGLYF